MAEVTKTVQELLEEARKNHQLKDYTKSIEICSKILEKEEINIEALTIRGDSKRMLGNNFEALKDLSKASEWNPNNIANLENLASAKIEIGQVEEGLKILERAEKSNPNNRFTFQTMGWAKCLLGRFDEALADLNKADQIEQNLFWTLWKRGIVYRKLGKLRESHADLSLAKLLDKGSNIVFELAETTRAMGMYEVAKNHITTLSTPNFQIVRAHIALDTGNLVECEKLLKEVEMELESPYYIEEFRIVKKLMEEKRESSFNAAQEAKRQPTKVIENMEKSIEKMQERYSSDILAMKNTLLECKSAYTESLGAEAVAKQIESLKEENKKLQKKLEETDQELRCLICMDRARDTVIMPCLHFLFCKQCIDQHGKTSNQCPSCRQVTTGSIICRLKGEIPSKTKEEKEKEKEKKRKRENNNNNNADDSEEEKESEGSEEEEKGEEKGNTSTEKSKSKRKQKKKGKRN